MVRITASGFEKAYETIRKNSVEGNCLIFVASDVDAICAWKILQTLLKSDYIHYKLVPVSGYHDLEKANEELIATDPDLRSVIMLNCGGMVDVWEMFGSRDYVTIYVIDSHRPVNLENCLEDNRNVYLFDDSVNDSRVVEQIAAYDAIMYGSDRDLDMSDTDQDSDSDEYDASFRSRQRRRLDDDTQNQRERRRKRQRQQRMITDYYSSGAYYGSSISGQIYTLATQLAKTNNELLWLAIIGVTAQYIFERIDTEKYMYYVRDFMDDVARFNIVPEDEAAVPNENAIHVEDEYRFMLFRHWSLYDSMFHSGYVASKLGVWKEFGRKRLNNMFARMGFSLQQCQQVYTHMDMDLKQMLRDKIETVAPMYGLTDICFPSFTRTYGWKQSFSASDVVYAIATLLETSPSSASRLGEKIEWNENEDWDALENDSGEHGDGLSSVRRKWWMRNFYTAYDSIENAEGLLRGVSLCMKIQRAIVRLGTSVIDKKGCRTMRNYRAVTISEGPDLPLFQHPLTLSKLALFLTDAFREHARRNLPFVISSLDEEHDSYLVVANTGAPTFGDVRKNPFGAAFQKAAELTNSRISFDSFETSVLQIHRSDFDNFFNHLLVED